MKINNYQVIISKLEVESVEGEYVMYSQISKKIIVFNKTASLIWDIIKDSYDKDFDLSTESISEEIVGLCNIPAENKRQIVADVQEIIDCFYKENLLVKMK